MKPLRSRTRVTLAVSMTPMIDVTFLLIIFFLVNSHLAKQENNIRLELPVSSTAITGMIGDQRSTATVQVLPDASFLLGGQPVTLDEFRNRIQARHNDIPGGLRIRIRTDRTVPYEPIARILKTCASVGVVDVVFAVHEPK